VKCLLDTCTFLWLNLASDRLSHAARELCADDRNTLFLSAASAWEITAKCRAGQLILPVDPGEYIPTRRTANGIHTLRFREEDAVHLMRLPPIHKDPFDRMLICQAMARGLTILTPDPHIAQYPIPVIW
jgi:PIN domain nuclease of toxin-antitoxin system